jgi:ABC-type transport system involved in multi-copper enzyme maturation permease subunit
MTDSIVPQLVRKDFLIWRRLILIFCSVSLACIAAVGLLHGHVPNHVMLNLGFTLLVTPAGTLGIVLLMQTNVFEKAKSTQLFIMSLPVTARRFTLAKLLVNVPVFGAVWLVTTAAAFAYTFGLGLLPPGAIPMMTMIFLGVFVAYSGILAVSLLSQSLGTTILAILFFEVGTSIYLWIVALVGPVGRHVFGPIAVWNRTAIAVVALQVLVAVAAMGTTLVVQTRRRDFV